MEYCNAILGWALWEVVLYTVLSSKRPPPPHLPGSGADAEPEAVKASLWGLTHRPNCRKGISRAA